MRKALPFALFLLTSTIASAGRCDVVTDWNAVAVTAVQSLGPSTPLQSRALAMVHLAMFDALNAIDRRYASYTAPLTAEPGASREAAAAAAAYEVLVHLVPLQKAMLDRAIETSLHDVADGPARRAGLDLGRLSAGQMLAQRADDGASRKVPYAAATTPGAWRPTPPDYRPAALPHWPQVKPFLVPAIGKVPVPDPPRVDSAAYARDVEEVRIKGGLHAAARSSEQAAVAIFWTIPTSIPWNAAARSALEARKTPLVEGARLLALMNAATADSQIAVWAVKYRYNTLRPVQAIRDPRALNNPGISADPTWESFITTPAHPDYVSGHAGYSGAAQAVLATLLGDETKVSLTYPPNGVTRRWQRFSQIAHEVEDARAWGGIHTRTADERATDLGRQLGMVVTAGGLPALK